MTDDTLKLLAGLYIAVTVADLLFDRPIRRIMRSLYDAPTRLKIAQLERRNRRQQIALQNSHRNNEALRLEITRLTRKKGKSHEDR